MAAAAETIRLPAERDSLGSRILRVLTRGPLNIVLAVIGLLWLVPTVGLFITSILPVSALASGGWWQIFTHPSVATWSNYGHLFHNSGLRRR